MTRYAALLRGVNVGGKNKLPMKDLVAMFESVGCTDVVTYIQSGNVVFDAKPAVAKTIAATIADRIAQDAGLRVPVVVRSAAELTACVAQSPFVARGVDEDQLHVMFLADAPTKAAVAKLDPRRSPGDELVVVGRDVHLRMPNGVGRTKLTNAYVDATLGTVSTQRNWRTVLQLVALAA